MIKLQTFRNTEKCQWKYGCYCGRNLKKNISNHFWYAFFTFAPLFIFSLSSSTCFYHVFSLWLMLNLFSVETVQLALWFVDTPTNPCLCSLISSVPWLCVHMHLCLGACACVTPSGFCDKKKHIILKHHLAWHNPISSPLCFFFLQYCSPGPDSVIKCTFTVQGGSN